MSFLKQWADAKKAFEDATNAKKPVEKVLGVFRQSTGIEDALKVVDKAIEKKDGKALKAAFGIFASAQNKYVPVLMKVVSDEAAKDDADMNYVTEGQMLNLALVKIQAGIDAKVKELTPGEIEVGNFAADWKAAKKSFKDKTGKKKPSANPDDWFRKGSSVESCLEAVDKAITKNDAAAFLAAAKAYDTAMTAYKKVLEGIMKTEADKDYKTQVKGLIDNLGSIQTRVEARVKKLAT